MKREQTIVSLVLALALLLGLTPAAQAAVRPELICSPGRAAGELELTLEGLDGSGIYGAQVELTLSGEYPDCAFTPYSAKVYSPDCRTEVSRGRTNVTIYLTGQSPLNDRDLLELGTLALGAQAGDGLLPQSARMTLLNRGLEALTGRMAGTVPVTSVDRVPGGGTGGTGGTGSSGGGSGSGSGGSGSTGGSVDTPAQPPATTLPDPGSVPLPFVDVTERDWFYEAVRFVYARGMMGGTTQGTFSPEGTTTRGMIVTILHRLEGSPAGAGAAFNDVPAAMYYAQPIAWASANGIVTGFGDGSFRPDAPITREQLAAILMRYARYKGTDVSARASLDAFPDRGSVSSYAQEPMAWAVAAGLIGGMDGRLAPVGTATRAQAATILMRLCTNVLKTA